VYNLQLAALQEFPYRSDYYRIFSQINLALANSIVSGIPQGQTPSEGNRQTISSLLQQAVNNARAAVALAPTTSINWQNLSQIYRSLIGVGQGAEEFTILTLNQAIALDPANPLLRIELGGVYYQLQQYDAAQQQFLAAINLKPDLANAYFNLANAQEANREFPQALASYEATLRLVTNAEDKKQLEEKITTLRKTVGETNTTTQIPEGAQADPNQPPLGVNSPAAPLPTTAPQVRLSPPPAQEVETTPTPTPEEE
jgi:tetratricopeptide (TPR) repeat protein